MPIFKYYCKNCDFTFELLLPRYDSEAFCPKCGNDELEKALNKVAALSGKSGSCAFADSCQASGGGCGCAGAGGCCGHKH